MNAYAFKLAPTELQSVRLDLQEIPGVVVSRGRITAPLNAAWIVERFLRERPALRWIVTSIQVEDKLVFETEQPTSTPEWPPGDWPPEVYPWVAPYMTRYQCALYQRRNRGLLVVWPTGAGKTLASIIWALGRPKTDAAKVICVVTRASSRRQFAREVERYSSIKPIILTGRDISTAPPSDPIDTSILVTAWETLSWQIDAILKAHPTIVIFDEIHKAKSWKRWNFEIDEETGKRKFSLKDNTTASAMRLSRAATWRLGLTATPVKDRVRDLWAQLDLILPDEFGKFRQFAKRYCDGHEGTYGYDSTGKSNQEELLYRFSFVHDYVSVRETHGALPPKRRIIKYIPPQDQLADRSSKLSSNARSALELRLMESASRKRKVLVELVSDAVQEKQKVVIFTGRRKDVRVLYQSLDQLCKQTAELSVWAADGSDTTAHRDLVHQAYMAHPGPCVLIGTGDAWGESLDLQDTDLALFAMLPYTPGAVRQWEGRFSRLGQKRPVIIMYLINEGTVDEHVASILIDKLPAAEAIAKDEDLAGIHASLTDAGTDEEVIARLLKVIGS